MIRHTTHILILIVIAQFACVSLWFAGNGVMEALMTDFSMSEDSLGHVTTAVQLGFIIGTLIFSMFALADRVSPSLVFFISAILAAISNLGLIISDGDAMIIYSSRFLTGFFLAGIYPVGMKIASDYFHKGLGKALGYLLGALVLGTAFPHLLRSQLSDFSWQLVIQITSCLAVLGGALIYFLVPDGPFRKRKNALNKGFITDMFTQGNFRAAAFGYFGHMWELYAFWAFVPVIIPVFIRTFTKSDVSLFSFFIIAIGAVGCILGGYSAQKFGSYKVAFMALASSCLCCVLSPLVLTMHPIIVFLFFLFWGMMVIMDSPQFSTLVAHTVPGENKASALTFVNCIGFSITIVSIQLINILALYISGQWLLFFLFPGPALGLMAMMRWDRQQNEISHERIS